MTRRPHQAPWRWLLMVGLLLSSLTAARADVTYVSSAVGPLTNSAVSSVQILNPAGLAAGDLMVAFLSQNDPGSPMVSTATGWTSVLTQTYNSGGSIVGVAVYYRFATAADISNGSFTFSFRSSRRSAGAILAFRGVDTGNPVNASASQGNASSTSLTAPSITTTALDTMLVALYGNAQGSNTSAPPGGMTEVFDGSTGAGPNGVGIEGAYATQTAAGATGTRVATATTAAVNVGVLLALRPAFSQAAEYRFEEATWTGAAGEVVDSSVNALNGTAYAGATTASGSPAYTSGSQSTCRYGYFDRSGTTRTYVQLPASLPKMQGSYSVAAWIRSPDPTAQQQRIFANDDNDDGWGLSLADSTSGGIRLFNRNVTFGTMSGQGTGSGGVILQTPNNLVAANTWYYVAATVDAVNKIAKIYVYDTAGSRRALTTGTYTGTWCASGTCTGATAIGGETSASSEGRQTAFHFLGNIDEARIYQGVLSQTDIEALLTTVRPCAASAPDHLQIEYPGDGLTCAPSTVTVKACADAACSTLYAGGSISGTLAPGGAAFAIGTTGTTTATVSSTTSPATLGATLDAASIKPVNSTLACLNTASSTYNCSMTFNSAGFIFSAGADGAAANIADQVAGTASATYYLRAVRTNTSTKACEAALVGVNAVNMAYQCNNPTTCSGTNLMSINGGTATTIARNDNAGVTSYAPVSMTFDANGNAPFTLNYSDVGQVTLFASRAAGATASGTLLSTLSGSSNPFVVKPGGFVISNIKQSATPQTLNPAASGAGGSKFLMAGEAFTATVTATTSGGATTPNFGRELAPEGVVLTPALVAPAGGSAGSVTNAQIAGGSFSGGVATVNNLSWSEAGIMTLTPSIGDGNYLGAGDVTGAQTGNIGRFYPAQFAISTATLTNTCTVATPYTYFGEDGFTTAFTLTAQNLAGGTTSNYVGAFAKLNLSTYASYGFSAATLPAGSSLASSATAPTGVAPNSSWTNGSANVLAQHVISRPTALVGQTSVTVSAAPTDGEVPAGSATTLGSATLRYGRLQLLNAYGSELLALPMTLRTQYWNGSAWVVNTDDSCTAMPAPTAGNGLTFYPEVAAGAMGNHLSAGETTASVNASGKMLGGNAGLRFSAPGTGNSGFVDVAIPLAARPWLRFPWAGAGDADPSGRATFGIYKSRLIYSRENY